MQLRRTLLIVGIVLPLMAVAVTATPQGGWTKHPDNPVLEPGPPGSWDDDYVTNVAVVRQGSLYHMWYTGNGVATSGNSIGYATSFDGVTWTKYNANPVLQPGEAGSWDEIEVSAPAVFFDGSIWRMWYAGFGPKTQAIGYATSLDGANWTKHPSNPVFSPDAIGSWDSSGVFAPDVIWLNDTYHMWYSGRHVSESRIGYATSNDGINWTRHSGNPVLDIGSPGSWEEFSVVSPSVTLLAGAYNMWYQGGAGSPYSTALYQIGHATSSDGIHWTKDTANPVLSPGPEGDWDDYNIHYPSVILYDDLWRMWYHGFDALSLEGGTARIGYAEAPAPVFDNFVYLPAVLTDN